MSVLIDPRIDVYGRDGRSGALADLVEFYAIKGLTLTVAELEDLIADMGWSRRPRTQIRFDDDADGDGASPSLASQAFSLIDERSEVLMERYPFVLTSGRLSLAPSCDPRNSAYIALLAITVAHAWKVPCGETSPESVLESVVAEALGLRLAAVGLGTGDRSGLTFAENLRAGADELGLTSMRDPLPRRVRAKDAGVDTLAGHIWHDRRPGQWLMIGQVTCSMTDRWAAKLVEPKPGIWRAYLQEPLHPMRFLAVPHHVDPAFFRFLLQQEEGLVIDRLRIVLLLERAPEGTDEIVQAILLASAA